ncbi:hypothetical protein ScPMuIL_006243 [Solemya velum]
MLVIKERAQDQIDVNNKAGADPAMKIKLQKAFSPKKQTNDSFVGESNLTQYRMDFCSTHRKENVFQSSKRVKRIAS